MDLTPQTVADAHFNTVRKGFDPEEVRAYLHRVSHALEASQQQSAAMEARARAALAKVQEMGQVPAPTPNEDVESISRTLLLAQRTADATLAEANAQAASILGTATAQADSARSAATAESATVLDQARLSAAQLVDAARLEARRTRDDEYLKAENEVQSLLARRDFLLADVEQFEQHLAAQRERLRQVAATLTDLAERVPDGLGDMRRPLLSASDGDGNDTAEVVQPDDTGDEAEPQSGSDQAHDQ